MSSKSMADKLLSDIVAYRTYAKYLPELHRREVLPETILRNMHMHMDKFPHLIDKIYSAYEYIKCGDVLPSMRGLQFGGPGIEYNPIRQYSCAFHNIDRVAAFSETLYLLLSGTGVGYSVQRSHVDMLPCVRMPTESMYYPVHDSIEGWAMALAALVDAFLLRKPEPKFDFYQIRPEGSLLKTTGGIAPGPAKLEKMLSLVRNHLMAVIGRKMRPIEVHDILCIISDCVRSGGIREAALICLFDRFDQDMLKCKSGTWWESHPWRGRANNSAILPRGEVSQEEFNYVYNMGRTSLSGEPAFYWTNNKFEYGANPCVEIALKHRQFCNLTTVNQSTLASPADLHARVTAAAFIGTLQAAYTDFPFLDTAWKTTTEDEALIGVSYTGIADASIHITPSMLRDAAKAVVNENIRTAGLVGINASARCTTGKPEGSSSAILGTASGIHARYAKDYYLRRIRMKRGTPLANFLTDSVPHLMEESLRDDNLIIVLPQKSPPGAISRDQESALDLFNRAMFYNINWVAPGHIRGDNRNNISCTINVRETEWDTLMNAMWEHRHQYNGLSILPYDGGTYVQAPFEMCDKNTYDKYMSHVKALDFTEIVEFNDTTDRKSQSACAGGACEFT